MDTSNLIHDYLNFLNNSPTPFHAVDECIKKLEQKSFKRCFDIPKAEGLYYFKLNKTLLIAITIPPQPKIINIIGTHNDSPVLKLKNKFSSSKMGLKPYGGGLWHTWFDRTLSIAGQVIDKDMKTYLINIKKPIVYIPSLAIHLDMNEIYKGGFNYNKETHLSGLCGLKDINELILLDDTIKVDCEIISHDLSLYDTQGAIQGGCNNQFIYSARQDNLLSTFVAIEAITTNPDSINIVAVFDHEEVGSETISGAQSALFGDITKKLIDKYKINIDDSIFISCDVAHGLNPNYPEKYEKDHSPLLGNGIVIKYSNRYATNNYTAARMKKLASKYQEFILRNDCFGGGTIGPMAVCRIGIKGVDIGAPVLGMHSIKEVSHVDDIVDNYKLFADLFSGK